MSQLEPKNPYDIGELSVIELMDMLYIVRFATKNDPTFEKFSIFLVAALEELKKTQRAARTELIEIEHDENLLDAKMQSPHRTCH